MKRVLIVDDTRNIRIMLTSCLEIDGYQVMSAEDGKAVISLLQKEKFDLIFLDIKMPGISGTEILKQVRSIGLDVPIIIMTAFATIKNAVECTKLGAVAYLQKPFTPDKIRTVLKGINASKSLNDSYYETWMQNGYKYMKEKRFEEALATFKKCLSLKPDITELYDLLGKVYAEMGEPAEAKRFFAASEHFK